jgi:cell division septation protein DedD
MDSIRNLEQIQENEPAAKSGSKLGALIVASLAGACIVFAVLALVRRPMPEKSNKPDPLGALAGKPQSAASARAAANLNQDVAFPDLLSDDPNPTTAMAALRTSPAGSGSGFAVPPGTPTLPPPATDKLPVVPLPAQNYLALSPVVTQPRDSLAAMAQKASTPSSAEVDEGHTGGIQLQVSSFRLQEEAQKFEVALRQRGHKAHVESAQVPNKGTWYRVRIGPFKTKADALKYRQDFEAREHMVPFLVEPQDKRMTATTVGKGKRHIAE